MQQTESDARKDLSSMIEAATAENYEDVIRKIALIGEDIPKEAYAVKLAKKLDINKSTVLKELKVSTETATIGNPVTFKAVFDGLVDLVINEKGEVCYLVKTNEGLKVLSSWQDAEGNTYMPPDKKHLTFTLPRAEKVMKWHEADNTSWLFADIITYLKRFSYLSDETWQVLALNIFQSYLQDHADVQYFPVIYFYAVAERGKSRTAKSMLSIMYRGIHLVDLKPANIFRFSENLKATLFFDCTDLWTTAERSDCSDILLGRFEKGCRLARVQYPDRGAFADQVYYDVYGSTIVATNEPANLTFESRCLMITMPNRPGYYEDITPEKGIELKERLTAWRARMMGVTLEQIDIVTGITGRLWDISKPLFQLCQMINPSVRESMKSVILGIAGQKSEDLKDSIEGRIVAAIVDLSPVTNEPEWEIPNEDILKLVNLGKEDRFAMTPQKLGKRLKSLGIDRKEINGYKRAIIKKKDLEMLKIQYGLAVKPLEELLELATTDDTGTQDISPDAESPDEVVESSRELQEEPPPEKKKIPLVSFRTNAGSNKDKVKSLIKFKEKTAIN